MNYGRAIVVTVMAAAAGAVQAGGVGIRAGSTGVGADLGWDIAPTLGGRVGISAMSVNTDFDTSGANYDAKVKLANLNLFLDWSPLGPFRLTGGFIANDNKIDITGRPTSGVAAGTTLTGQVTPERSFAPYLGVGYGNVWTKGINFYADLGVMFQGSPQVSSLTCQGNAAQCAAAQPQIEAERQRVQDELKRFKYYPVANIGLTIGW